MKVEIHEFSEIVYNIFNISGKTDLNDYISELLRDYKSRKIINILKDIRAKKIVSS